MAAPFGFAARAPLALQELASRFGVTLVEGTLAAVEVGSHKVRLADGVVRRYDLLLVAIGARRVPALTGALTFRGSDDVPALESLLAEAVDGRCRSIAIVVPVGATWGLPAYELAVMAAIELRMRSVECAITVVTCEPEPRVGAIPHAQEELLHAVFDFADLEAADVMVPAGDVVWLDASLPPADALERALATPYTRFPVARARWTGPSASFTRPRITTLRVTLPRPGTASGGRAPHVDAGTRGDSCSRAGNCG